MDDKLLIVKHVEDDKQEELKPTKRQRRMKKINATVNFVNKKRNKTSISYEKNGSICSVFIDGIYDGDIEIEFYGSDFNNKSIANIKKKVK